MDKATWTFQELKELHRAVTCLPEQPCLNCPRSISRGLDDCAECGSPSFWSGELTDPFCLCPDVKAALRRQVDGWSSRGSEPSSEYLRRCDEEKVKLVGWLREALAAHEFAVVTSTLCALQQFSVHTPEWYWDQFEGLPHKEAFFFVGAYYSARATTE